MHSSVVKLSRSGLPTRRLLLMTLERFLLDPPLGGLDSTSGPKRSNSLQAARFVSSRIILSYLSEENHTCFASGFRNAFDKSSPRMVR